MAMRVVSLRLCRSMAAILVANRPARRSSAGDACPAVVGTGAGPRAAARQRARHAGHHPAHGRRGRRLRRFRLPRGLGRAPEPVDAGANLLAGLQGGVRAVPEGVSTGGERIGRRARLVPPGSAGRDRRPTKRGADIPPGPRHAPSASVATAQDMPRPRPPGSDRETLQPSRRQALSYLRSSPPACNVDDDLPRRSRASYRGGLQVEAAWQRGKVPCPRQEGCVRCAALPAASPASPFHVRRPRVCSSLPPQCSVAPPPFPLPLPNRPARPSARRCPTPPPGRPASWSSRRPAGWCRQPRPPRRPSSARPGITASSTSRCASTAARRKATAAPCAWSTTPRGWRRLQIEIHFDPSYQTLALHHVDVIRDGRRATRLDRRRV